MKHRARIIALLLLLLAGTAATYAQGLKVSGKVIDNEGLEVIGASVTIKGVSGVGTITDLNGKFEIQVSDAEKSVLVFSFIGMKNVEMPVKGRAQLDITMQPDNQLLEEVVVVGYNI